MLKQSEAPSYLAHISNSMQKPIEGLSAAVAENLLDLATCFHKIEEDLTHPPSFLIC